MPRAIRSSRLESKSARQKLPLAGKPVYKQIGRGLHLGYRKNKSGGRWVMRRATEAGGYIVEAIADADDVLPANGHSVLDFFQASQFVQEHAKRMAISTKRDQSLYTVSACLDDYFRANTLRMKTAKESRSRADSQIEPHLGARLVAKLTSEEIREWHIGLAQSAPARRSSRGTPRKAAQFESGNPEAVRRRKSSANRVLTILKAALNHAFHERHAADDQAWRRVRPFGNADAARIRFLSEPEIRRFLVVLDRSFAQLVRAALHTGARYGELIRLTVGDFDQHSKTLFIAVPKNGPARKVYLSDGGIRFFELACVGRPLSEVMFGRDDGRPWGASHQVRRMNDASALARLDEPVSFHELRHTYASHAAMNGMPLFVLAQNLGHSDTRMVERHYSHLSDRHKQEMVRRNGLKIGD